MQSGCPDHPAASYPARRHGSTEPGYLLPFFLAAFLVSLGIGLGFALAGAWPVLPFAGAEVLALGLALRLAARQRRRPAGGARLRRERRRVAQRLAARAPA